MRRRLEYGGHMASSMPFETGVQGSIAMPRTDNGAKPDLKDSDAKMPQGAPMPLKFVICGMEHSGTTLVSDLFRQVPGIDAGFEVGVLLRESPAEFVDLKPFSENIFKGWGITEEEFRTCCTAPTHAEFYERLKGFSRSIDPQAEAIFDKTPRYIAQLDSCIRLVDVPFIVTHKDPRALVASDFKRAKTSEFAGWYRDYMPRKRRYMKTCYDQWKAAADNSRVLRIGLEELAMNARESMERTFAHVGLEFSLDYAVMKNVRFKNTRANFVSAAIAFEYKSLLTGPQRARISRDFADMAEWFYD